MKKHFLNRLRYPYLQTNLPENILPGKDFNKKEGKNLYNLNLRSTRKDLQASRGLLLRTRRGRLSIYAKTMYGGDTAVPGGPSLPSTKLDALEMGSVLSTATQTSIWLNKSQRQPKAKKKGVWVAQLKEGSSHSEIMQEASNNSFSSGQNPCASASPRAPTSIVKTSGALTARKRMAVLRARGRFYQSISQLEGGVAKRQEKRFSQVSTCLSERRKLRILYGGLSNREVDTLIKRGLKEGGRFNDNLFKLLERRLDVMLWRIGFLPTIPAARNWICRGRVSVNKKTLTIANYLLEPGDVVSILPQYINSLRQLMSEKSEKYWGSIATLNNQGYIDTFHLHHSPWLNNGPEMGRQFKGRFPTDPLKGLRALPPFSNLIGAPDLGGLGSRHHLVMSRHVNDRKKVNWLTIRPSHVEISYLCFVAIYLYPSQRIFLPAPIDMGIIQRW